MSSFSTIGTILGAGVGTLIAPGIGTAIGAGIGGSIGGGIDSNNAASSAQDNQSAAYQAQAAAMNHQADAALEAAKLSGQAQIAASQNSMKAAITAAALGQTSTTDTVQHLSPVQLGANAMASFDMAMKWNKFMALTEQGYQPGAKNWILSGKDGKTLYKDPTYNLLSMGQQVKDASLSAMNLVGVKSAANPYGVQMDYNEFKLMMSMKHPEDMLEPSAQDKAQYQARYNAWAAAHPLEASLLKDPQQNLKDQMGEKSPIHVDNNGNVTGGTYEGQGQDYRAPISTKGVNPNQPLYVRDGGGGGYTNTPQPGFHRATAQEAADIQGMHPYSAGDPGQSYVANSGAYATEQAALKKGYINKDGMIDMGAVMKSMPSDLLDPPEFSPFNQLNPAQEKQVREQFDQFSNVQLDPKLVSVQNKGYGVQAITVKNADGTVAGTYLQGLLRDAQGQQHMATIAGSTLHEWDDFQAQADNMGVGWVGMARGKRGGETPGGMDAMGSSLDGMPKLSEPGTAAYNSFNPYQSSTNAGTPKPQSAEPGSAEGAVPNVKPSAATPAGSLGTALGQIGDGSNVPSGYSGAPLAAGG